MNHEEAISMNSIDTVRERMEAVEIFEIPGLFSVKRIDRAAIPKGMYAYDLQASKEDWGQPCRIARQITERYFGTVLTASPVSLPESGFREAGSHDFIQSEQAERLTVAEFEAMYLSPTPEAQRLHRPRRRCFSGVSAR